MFLGGADVRKFLLWTGPYCVLSFLLCCSANLFGAVDGVLSGKVLDAETAQPLTGIGVTYRSEGYTENDFTDADGKFTLTDLPDGIAEITAMPDVATGYAYNLPPGSNSVNINEGQDKSNCIIALQRGALVTGYIKDPDGNPAGAVEYSYSGRMSGGWGDTDVNGRYQIRLPLGTYVISLDEYNLSALPQKVTITDINQPVDVNDMTVYSEQTGGQISGDVSNSDACPKTGQFFIVAFEAGTVIDPNTWYTVKSVAGTELPEAGPFAITALPPYHPNDIYLCVESGTTNEIQSLVVRDSALNVLPGTTGIGLNYKSEGSTVSGRVENTDGQAVMGAAVLLTDSATGNFAGFGRVDPNGEYVIYNVPAGTYTATAVHSKYLNASTPVGGLEGLLGNWLMNDNAADATVVDSSGNNNNGTAQQNTSALHTTGKIDGALTFNGMNDYVKLTYDQDGWTKSDSNPLITGLFGSVWYNAAGDYHFFYSDGMNAKHATSSDGLTWTDDVAHNPILTIATVVMVWKEEDTWYMLYRSSEFGYNKICLATASAPEGPWTKNANNPVLSGAGTSTWEGNSTDPWGIMKVGSTYYLWYNNVGVTPRQSGLAISTDLIHWTKDSHNPIFGDADKQMYCIHPFKYDNWYYMITSAFYSPQAWMQFRLYRDSNPTFYPQEREYLGTILFSTYGSWDTAYLDTPSVMTTNINRDSFPDNDIWLYYSGRSDYPHPNWKTGLAKTSLANLAAIQPRPEVNVPLFRLTDAISISLWAKQDKKHTGNYIGLLAKDGCYLLTINANKLRGYIGSSGGWCYTTGTTNLAVDTWYHFVMTFDKNGDKKVRIYVNAVEEGTPATTIYGINIRDSEIRIGSYGWGWGANYFDGVIDNVLIFNRALSKEEVEALYNGGDGIETIPPLFGDSSNNNIVMSFVGEKEGADLNGDGFVNMLDLAKFADQWLQPGSLNADFNQDSTVDFADLSRVAESWRWQAIWYHD